MFRSSELQGSGGHKQWAKPHNIENRGQSCRAVHNGNEERKRRRKIKKKFHSQESIVQVRECTLSGAVATEKVCMCLCAGWCHGRAAEESVKRV